MNAPQQILIGEKMTREDRVLFARQLETPIGAMIALADDAGLRLLDFVDRPGLPRQIRTIRRVLACAVVTGEHRHLDAVERELGLYFAGKPSAITTTSQQAGLEAKVGGIVLAPIGPGGTPGGSAFQRAVWGELRRIPSGRTRSYAEQARAVGKPLGVRAVARANGENFLSLITPCHRVIGSDGSMTGYSGGVARKRWLLEHEAKMAGVSVAGLFAGVGVGG